MAISSIKLEHIWQQYFQKIGVSMFSYYQVYDGVEKQNHSSLMFQYGLPKIWKNIFNRQGYFQKHPLVSIVLEKMSRCDILISRTTIQKMIKKHSI